MFRSLHKKDTDVVVEGGKKATAWLKELRMECYANAFVEAGYEDLSYIAEMSLDDVMEIEGMKKPHAKRIYKASRNLTTNSHTCPLNPRNQDCEMATDNVVADVVENVTTAAVCPPVDEEVAEATTTAARPKRRQRDEGDDDDHATTATPPRRRRRLTTNYLRKNAEVEVVYEGKNVSTSNS